MFEGHSRGGVTANEAAARMQFLFEDAAAELDKATRSRLQEKFSVDVVTYDPVAGGDTWSEIYNKIDMRDQTDAMRKNRLSPLNAKSQSTVFYSINTQYTFLKFTPQTVLGTDRVILNPFDHSASLSYYSTYKNANKDEVKKSSAIKVNTETQMAYKGMSINDMPKGIYFMDEKGQLVKMRNRQEAKRLRSTIEASNTDVENVASRQKVIENVIDAFFDSHPELENN